MTGDVHRFCLPTHGRREERGEPLDGMAFAARMAEILRWSLAHHLFGGCPFRSIAALIDAGIGAGRDTVQGTEDRLGGFAGQGEVWGAAMGVWMWPVEVRTRATPRVLLGRFVHWGLVVAAFVLIACGVIASCLALSGPDGVSDLPVIDAGQLSVFASFCAICVFFVGRLLRYLVSRE